MEESERKILEKVERHRRMQIEEIMHEVTQFKRKAKEGYHVTTVTREQLEKKLARAESPMVVFQGWSGSTGSPGSISYSVGIRNPDPVTHIWTFAQVFVGLANIVPDVGAAVAAVDDRFPRMTLPAFAGLSIAPGATETLSFDFPVPAGIEPSNYVGNTFVFGSTWQDVGTYFDRSIFVFGVT